jgi:hypothetical protein
MSNRTNSDVFHLLSMLDTPVGTTYRDAWGLRQEQLAAEAEAAAQSAQDEGGRGFLNNQARGIGAAFTRVGGEIVEGLAALDAAAPKGVVPGVPHYAAAQINQQRDFERDMTDAEFRAHKEAGYQNAVKISDQIKGVDFGYDKERNSVEKTKELFTKGNWLAGSMSVPGMLTDQLSQSIPYMLNAPVTALAIGGNTARERVNNTEGKLAPDGEDVAISAVVGTASGVLERLLPKMIFRPGETMTQAEAKAIADSATKYAIGKIGKEAARGATVEALTESIQTGVLEYVGQRYGTDKAMSLQEAAMQGLEGALIGGGIGGGLGAVRGAVDARRNVGAARSAAVGDGDVDLPVNGEQLRSYDPVEVGGGAIDAAPDSIAPVDINAPLLREAGNPSDPNDRYKFELDTDSFVSNLRRRIDERKKADFAQKITPIPASAEPEQETTLADVARKFGEENGLIQKPIAYDGGVNFERVPVPKPDAFTLAPLEPAGGIDFTAQEIPARTNQLASGIEKAISANIDKARNSRMPDNLKDVRLLRSRYRDHLSDVAAGVESNAAAFEKADSLLDLVAKNGGLNAAAWQSEGVDPADAKNVNSGSFAKVFRADGGMTPDDLAEFASQNGFAGFTDSSGAPVSGAAIEAVLGELSGSKRYSSADESKLQAAQSAPDYVKELADFGTPTEIKTAVTKALNGEKLGERQARIVQELLDSTNRFKRDDAAIGEKWESRARTMLSNKGNRALDEWRNRDEHEADANTEEAALNELMADAMVQYGIDPDKVIAAHEQYSKRYPDSLGKLTYAMTAWVSANKPANREPEQNGARDSVPGYRSDRRDDEGVQVPLQRSAGEPGAVEAGLSVPRQRQEAEAGSAPSGIESGAPAELGSDSAGRDAGLRQSVELPEGWDKSLIKARRIAKSIGVPAYNTMRLGALADAIRAKRAANPSNATDANVGTIDSNAAEVSSNPLQLPAQSSETAVSDEISASNQEPINKPSTNEPQPSAGVSVSAPQETTEAVPEVSQQATNSDLLKSVPPKILKSLMVDYQVYNEDAGQYETEKVSARDALKSVNDDISTFESMLACVKGGK